MGAKLNGRGPRAGVGVLVGQQPPPHQLGVWGNAVNSRAGFGAEPRPPKGFPLFSALRMSSPDTIILLIVDSHAAIGGKTPVAAPCVRACHDDSDYSLLLLLSILLFPLPDRRCRLIGM